MGFKGTKGKWITTESKLSVECNNEQICAMFSSRNIEEILANSLLISKAPEMLEMIKLLIDRLEENDLKELSAVKRAKQLIKEATEI